MCVDESERTLRTEATRADGSLWGTFAILDKQFAISYFVHTTRKRAFFQQFSELRRLGNYEHTPPPPGAFQQFLRGGGTETCPVPRELPAPDILRIEAAARWMLSGPSSFGDIETDTSQPRQQPTAKSKVATKPRVVTKPKVATKPKVPKKVKITKKTETTDKDKAYKGAKEATATAAMTSRAPETSAMRTTCDHCQLKKIRCNHEKPCGRCVVLGQECVFSRKRKTGPRIESKVESRSTPPSMI